MADLVIAEGVELDLRPGRIGSRFTALLLDLLVELAAFVALLVIVNLAASNASADTGAALRVGCIVAVLIAYPVLCETLTAGRSLGKAAAGLRVVRSDGGPVRFRHCLARNLTGLFADLNLPMLIAVLGGAAPELFLALVLTPGLLATLASPRGQRIGDLLAGTIVVRERNGSGHASVMTMPTPALAAWAGQATVGSVPTGLLAAGRQFIGRVHELDRPAAAELANELARQFSAFVEPPPPPGTPAFHYLVAVAGERFRREVGISATTAMPVPFMAARRTGGGRYL